jgi:teichuronic acid biosynthesis glycosyltransferase TuaC
VSLNWLSQGRLGNSGRHELTRLGAEPEDDAMRLKIAVVTPIFPIPAQPYRGHSIYETVRALTKRAEIEVFCPFARYPKWFQPSFDHRRPDLSYSPPEVTTRYFEYPALPGLTRCINGLVCAKFLEPYLRKCRPDVVINFWLYPEGYAAVEVSRKLCIPSVVGAIGSDLNSIADPASKWLTRLAMVRAAFVMTKSESLRQKAIGMGIRASKVRTMRNGCDIGVFRLADRSSARGQLAVDEQAEMVLFVGRLEPAKGIVELFSAFASLASRRPNLRLAYVGDGPGTELLRGKVKAAGLGSRVFLANARPSQEVAQWLAAANMLALPSYAEGCPNVIIEALSCGRPVISTNVGGIPELVNEECGILVAPRDVHALAEAIESAMKRKWNESSISEQFRRSWDQVADELLGVSELAVQGSQGGTARQTRTTSLSYQ